MSSMFVSDQARKGGKADLLAREEPSLADYNLIPSVGNGANNQGRQEPPLANTRSKLCDARVFLACLEVLTGIQIGNEELIQRNILLPHGPSSFSKAVREKL